MVGDPHRPIHAVFDDDVGRSDMRPHLIELSVVDHRPVTAQTGSWRRGCRVTIDASPFSRPRPVSYTHLDSRIPLDCHCGYFTRGLGAGLSGADCIVRGRFGVQQQEGGGQYSAVEAGDVVAVAPFRQVTLPPGNRSTIFMGKRRSDTVSYTHLEVYKRQDRT